MGNNIVIDVEKSTVDSQEVVPPRKSGRSIIEEQIELYEVQRDQSVDESIYGLVSKGKFFIWNRKHWATRGMANSTCSETQIKDVKLEW